MIHIRSMNADDIPMGLALCRHAGWNQLEDDWRRVLALNAEGVFVAEYDGTPCGTGSVTCYGAELAWIGMILVDPAYRRRGIATCLIEHSLDRVRAARVQCVKLDATELGRMVYLKRDFEDEAPICRCLGPRIERETGALPAIGANDWPEIALLDREAFGADRRRLLELLARDGLTAIIKSSERVQGYGFARRGHDASFLGPIVAEDAATAERLAVALLAALPESNPKVYWDILFDNVAARDLAESLGFRVARTLTRMRYGVMPNSGRLRATFGASGFETG